MTRIPDAHTIHSRLRLRQLRLVLALAEFGSLRRAADDIGMTQPAATKMLHEIESLLGVGLFERLPRGMRATAFGETVIYYARMVFAELSGMREELVALESGNLGRVAVGAIPALASGLLTRTIATLKQSHPRLSCRSRWIPATCWSRRCCRTSWTWSWGASPPAPAPRNCCSTASAKRCSA
jgi:DNA-binding transcriptional LysR family regulator